MIPALANDPSSINFYVSTAEMIIKHFINPYVLLSGLCCGVWQPSRAVRKQQWSLLQAVECCCFLRSCFLRSNCSFLRNSSSFLRSISSFLRNSSCFLWSSSSLLRNSRSFQWSSSCFLMSSSFFMRSSNFFLRSNHSFLRRSRSS